MLMSDCLDMLFQSLFNDSGRDVPPKHKKLSPPHPSILYLFIIYKCNCSPSRTSFLPASPEFQKSPSPQKKSLHSRWIQLHFLTIRTFRSNYFTYMTLQVSEKARQADNSKSLMIFNNVVKC